MAIRIEAYLSLERSLVNRLVDSWFELARDIVPDILNALRDQNYAEAERLIQTINTAPIFDDNLEYIRYITWASLLFGATRLTADAKRTIIARQGTNPIVEAAIDQLRVSVVDIAGEVIRDELLERMAAVTTQDPTTPTGESEREALEVVVKQERVINPITDFRNAANEGAAATLQLIASLHTSRLSAYGYTAEASVTGAVTYAISEQLDNRICPICRYMHGKTFLVEDAREALDIILREKDPNALRTLQSWPRQDKESLAEFYSLSNDELVERNWHIPPFHPNCRGQLVNVESIPRIEDTPSFQAALGRPEEAFDPLAAQQRVTETAALAETLDRAHETAKTYVLDQPDSDRREYGFVFSGQTGEPINTFRGSSSGINFTSAQQKQMAGGVFYHNHPRGTSLSVADFYAAGAGGMQQIVAVTNSGSRFIGRMRDLSALTAAQRKTVSDALVKISNRLDQQIKNNFQPLVGQGGITPNDLNHVHYHMMNEAMHETSLVSYNAVQHGSDLKAALTKVGNSFDLATLKAQLRETARSLITSDLNEFLLEI